MARKTRTGGHEEMGIPYISLFSGAMGLDLGLESTGFKATVAVEKDPEAVETIRENRRTLPVLGDICELTARDVLVASGLEIGSVPLIVGGPPCQAFSVFGNRKGTDDPRGQLIFNFAQMIAAIQPHTFVMENVRGLLSMPIVPKGNATADTPSALTEHGSLLRELIAEFEVCGYRVDVFVVNSVNYGAPQIRERLICIGNRHGLLAEFPEPRHSNRPEDDLPPFRTLGNAIGPESGFSDPDPEIMNFSERKRKYLAMVPEGGNWRSLPVDIQKESMGKSWYLKGGRSAYWRKLSFAFPSPTVVTMPNHAGTSMCHPTELRAISVAEAAAIQEFPADWRFVGSTTAKMRQIGNAVPTRLGVVTGEVVKNLLAKVDDKDKGIPFPASRVQHIRPHIRTRVFWKDGKALAGDHGYYDLRDADVSNQLELSVD